jgi:hypothetical protein
MKILNLDAFAAPKRSFTFGGKDYLIRDISVDDFIQNMNLVEEIEAAGKTDHAKAKVELAKQMVKSAVPDLSDAVLATMGIEQIGVLMRFIRGEFDPQAIADGIAEGMQPEGDAEKKSV